MKITTNITEERTVDVELPMFRKEKRSFGGQSHNYFAVLPDETAIDIFVSDDLTIIKHWVASKMAREVMIRKDGWDEITEDEFLEAHEKALLSLSLSPKWSELETEIENEMKNIDDIENVL